MIPGAFPAVTGTPQASAYESRLYQSIADLHPGNNIANMSQDYNLQEIANNGGGTTNPAFEGDVNDTKLPSNGSLTKDIEKEEHTDQGAWGNSIEFLMSCIAMSVGLGNIWRFPFTAVSNGSGAFLIPYIIVLFVIGKPLYYLEMALGQFSGKGSIKVWQLCPALKGLGYGQLFGTSCVLSYYSALMALTLFYFGASFSAELPWARCLPEWDKCYNSGKFGDDNTTMINKTDGWRTSSEIYFLQEVLHESDDISNGIGLPDWRLVLTLFGSWLSIYLVCIRGVKSSGKASYFLALFPYVIMIALFIRGVTLPGATTGMLHFITPQWDQLLNPKVWYAAVTQAFFSLSVSFGSIIMYSSYNGFSHNIHRDAWIVTSLDTLTSLLAGFTIFAIMGNLAYETGIENIEDVIQADTGLAFVSYPDAIAKMEAVPQLFSVLFFLMLFVLGIGSAVALATAIMTAVMNQNPHFRLPIVAGVICLCGFLIGIVYVTPGSQWILSLVDYYAVTLVIFIMATVEMCAVGWIYGLNSIARDVKFMLKTNVSFYWRLCWGIFTPIILIIILIYSLINIEPLKYKGKLYPTSAYAAGWVLLAFGVLQIPIWMAIEAFKNRNCTGSLIKVMFKPKRSWGPKDPLRRAQWRECCNEEKKLLESKTWPQRLLFTFLGIQWN